MTALIIRTLVFSIGPYYFWRRELRKEAQKRAIQERLNAVIRGY